MLTKNKLLHDSLSGVPDVLLDTTALVSKDIVKQMKSYIRLFQ